MDIFNGVIVSGEGVWCCEVGHLPWSLRQEVVDRNPGLCHEATSVAVSSRRTELRSVVPTAVFPMRVSLGPDDIVHWATCYMLMKAQGTQDQRLHSFPGEIISKSKAIRYAGENAHESQELN